MMAKYIGWSLFGAFALLVSLSCENDVLTERPPVLAPAVLVAPQHDSCVSDTSTPAFHWQEVEKASSYHVELSTEEDFLTVYRKFGPIEVNAFSFAEPLEPNVYFWRVLAYNDEGYTSQSDVGYFVLAAGVSEVELVEDYEIGCNDEMVISWQDNMLGDPQLSYDLQISSDPLFALVWINEQGLKTAVHSLESYNKSWEAGVYYIRVHKNYNNCPTEEEAEGRFILLPCEFGPPLLLDPEDQLCLNAAPDFQWVAVPDAQHYTLQIASDENFNTITVDSGQLDGTSYSLSQELPRGAYYWRVEAYSVAESTEMSGTRTFTVVKDLPQIELVDQQAPFCGNSAMLSWDDPLADDPIITYQVQVAIEANFDSLLFDGSEIADPFFELTSDHFVMDAGHYYYRIRRLVNGCPDPVWYVDDFEIYAPPAPPGKKDHEWHGCGPFNTTISWQASANTDAVYGIEIDSDTGFAEAFETSDTDYTFEAPMADAYHWRVRELSAVEGCGHGPWSVWKHIHIGAGRSWTEQLPSTVFSGREGFGAVVDPEMHRMWVYSGNDMGTDNNDVWMSETGLDWQLITPEADFGPRRWFASAFFDGRMWLIGGVYTTSGPNYGDVWSSMNGKDWMLNAAAPFPARHAPAVVVFKEKLWVIAGEGPDNCTGRSDVWSSADGYNWQEVTTRARFPNRDWHTATVFKGKMWVIGGISHDGYCGKEYLDDVWYSADGANWNKATEGIFPARAGHISLAYDGHLWVIGGTSNWPAATQSDVWYSEDGFLWCEATGDYDFSNRFGSQGVVFDEKMWVIGGNDGGYQNDLWTSE